MGFRILKRDLRLAARSGGSWAFGLIFMTLFLSLSAIALGGDMTQLRQLGAPLIWLSVTFAALLSVDRIFADDIQDGTVAQLWLDGVSFLTQAACKTASFALIYLLPLILAAPLSSLLFGLDSQMVMGLVLALLCALPGLAGFGTLAGALTAHAKGGFLAIVICAPLLIPLLIIGIAATTDYPDNGLATGALRATLGLSLFILAISIPASAAALKTNID